MKVRGREQVWDLPDLRLELGTSSRTGLGCDLKMIVMPISLLGWRLPEQDRWLADRVARSPS